MKRLIFILLSLLFLTSCKAKVDYFIEYALLPDNTYEVTRIDYVVNDPRYPVEYPSSIEIPSTYQGKQVTSISEFAFSYYFIECYLEELILPKTITNIKGFTFRNLNELKTVYYKGTITDWNNIIFNGAGANPSCQAGNIYF